MLDGLALFGQAIWHFMSPTTLALAFGASLLGIVIVTLMALLALDAIVAGQTTLDTIRGVGLHLIPAGVVLAVLLVAWRRPWAGGVLCFVLAVGYGVLADGRVSWMLAISLPLVVEGVLFLWSARIDRQVYAGRLS